MEVNISNYYMPNHDNQISTINAFIKSKGKDTLNKEWR